MLGSTHYLGASRQQGASQTSEVPQMPLLSGKSTEQFENDLRISSHHSELAHVPASGIWSK
jgi:hypothetical protein